MELTEAIKDIVRQFGIEVITTRRLVNFLDDVGGFNDEPPSSKKIMRELLDSGFGELLYKLSNKKDDYWQNTVRKASVDFASKYGYKNELVNRITNQLISGVGLNEEPEESNQQATNNQKINNQEATVENLGTDNLFSIDPEAWYDDENKKLTYQRKKRATLKKRKEFYKLIIPVVIVLIITWVFLLYFSSADERKTFEATIASANTKYSQGNYVAALDLYQKAADDYNASYFPSRYKELAHDKAVLATNKIIDNWEKEMLQLLQSKKFVGAKSLTLSLPDNMILRGKAKQTYESLLKRTDDKLAEYSTTMIQELLNDIYKNNGELSESGKTKLNEYITVLPDNYWLNFIKKKVR